MKSYLGEADFGAVAVIQSKYCAKKISVDQEMKLGLSNHTPRVDKSCSAQQTTHSPLVRIQGYLRMKNIFLSVYVYYCFKWPLSY